MFYQPVHFRNHFLHQYIAMMLRIYVCIRFNNPKILQASDIATKTITCFGKALISQNNLFSGASTFLIFFRTEITPLCKLSSSFTLNTFSSLKNVACNVFRVYFYSEFLEWISCFPMFGLISFCAYRFLRVRRSRSCSITRDTDRRSIVSSCTITSLMFYSVRRLKPSRTFFSTNVTSLVNHFQQFLHTIYVRFILWMIISNSCSSRLFIRKYLVTFSLYDNTISLVTNNNLK